VARLPLFLFYFFVCANEMFELKGTQRGNQFLKLQLCEDKQQHRHNVASYGLDPVEKEALVRGHDVNSLLALHIGY
jgi:hypothetical protein